MKSFGLNGLNIALKYIALIVCLDENLKIGFSTAKALILASKISCSSCLRIPSKSGFSIYANSLSYKHSTVADRTRYQRRPSSPKESPAESVFTNRNSS